MDVGELLKRERIVPVVVIDDAAKAVPLARTLMEAGLNSIEVTLRSAAALAAIEQIATKVPGLIVGAGSLRRSEQVSDIREAGAQFAVAPGWAPGLLDAAEVAGLPLLPGAATAAEMMQLFERGYALQKFFPAELAGGIPYLRAVGAPLPELRFVPTGGITAELAGDYLALPNVAAVGGTWITPKCLLDAGDFDRIGQLAADAIAIGM
ncbi:bifunctional 4-hydroxy-2-oxoglutarate aldolase/2-dehydro-3-deoxy-phosphogluconate aldolase [Gammaproteobacteria bacterium]|jgi:2-dehydro-3-deoxyphosphogluconate aldolase/(4S)-4-hydroxy-2-oxoglutarate aldolase|nr:bifunctional 4-hydroxy-2-oxoglutarate aldolase/2-dehydro-3-deoxy-phosphogluconate aldolase [Gammaproteobacteria bacterium]